MIMVSIYKLSNIIVHMNMIIVKTVMKDKVEFVAEDTCAPRDGMVLIIIMTY